MTIFNRSDCKKFCILLAITLVYVFPIILANVPYIDDLERTISGVGTDWKVDFRPLSWLLTEGLNFGEPLTDPAPLMLICGLIVLTGGITYFGKRYFNEYGSRSSILILATGLLCPFMLENYSYHYEAFFMLAGPGFLFTLFALKDESWKTSLVATALLLTVLSMYQVFLCTFFCLALLEVFYSVKQKGPLRTAGKCFAKRLAEAGIAISLYLLCTAYMFPTPGHYVVEHGGLLTPANPQFSALVQQHIGLYVKLLQDFLFSFNLPLQILGVSLLIAYILQLSLDYCQHNEQALLQKAMAVLLFCLTPVLLIIFSFLPLAFLANPVVFPRVMVSFMIFWMFLFSGIPYLAARYHSYLNLLFLPFLLFCFVFSFSYGQTLKAEYDHENYVVSMIATDIIKLNRSAEAVTFSGRVPPSLQYTLGAKKYPLFPRLITIYMDNKRYWGSVLLHRYGLPLSYSPALTPEEAAEAAHTAPIMDNSLYSLHFLGSKVLISFHEK